MQIVNECRREAFENRAAKRVPSRELDTNGDGRISGVSVYGVD